MHPRPDFFFLYGPPGSGKSRTGQLLAQRLALPFYDLDAEIERRCEQTIPAIFADQGESGFRARERAALQAVLENNGGVVALGGGALLDSACRQLAETNGTVVCLSAPFETLLARLCGDASRPLLGGEEERAARLNALLAQRSQHYASFALRLDSDRLSPEQVCDEIQILLGAFHVTGMGAGYDVRVLAGGLERCGALLRQRGLQGPVALVCDENVARHHAGGVQRALQASGYTVQPIVIPPGEAHKTPETVGRLWQGFLEGGLERGSTVFALGGGVVGDLAGFAAATYLRGVRWVCAPTTLLAMADASLGGKTGADLPQGKNLVGAFHPPSLVLADPAVLQTLPEEELRSGLAEVVKHGILQDETLFARCARGWPAVAEPDWGEVVRRAVAVKVRFIETDPYERGVRAALNLGHTIGHGVERLSDYRIRHGEAVAIGLVAEARLAERIGLAESGLAEHIRGVLSGLGLPTEIPAEMDPQTLQSAMQVDKKRAGGRLRYALPLRIGAFQVGVEVE